MSAPSSAAVETARPDSVPVTRTMTDDRVTPIEAVVVAYALWTVAFLTSLAVGASWAMAVPLSLVLGIGLIVGVRRIDTAGSGPRSRPRLGSAPSWVVAVVLLWGWIVEPLGFGGRVVLAAFVAVGLVLTARGSSEPSPTPTRSVLVAGAIGVASAVTHALSWTAFIVTMSVAGVIAAVRCVRPVAPSSERPSDSSWRSELSVLAVGSGFWLWTAFTRQFNPDDSYYLNKAAHYAGDARRFEVVNHIFGTPDEPHVPLADVLSAWEPLAGALSGVTGIHHATIMYVLLAPLAASMIPAANRYAARAFGVRRPDLIGLVAAAAIVHMEAYGDSILLVDKIFQGKGVLVLVVMPVVIGAGVRYWQNPTPRRLLVAVAAMVAALGLTPTAGAPVVGAGLAILVAGLVVTRQNASIDTRSRLLGVVPLAVATSFTVFAFWFQSSASQTDPTNIRFAGPENAWARRLIATRTDVLLDWNVGGLLVVFSLVVVMLVGRSAVQRSFFTLVTLGLFLLLFNPLLFTPLFDEVLHLNFLAWRFGWILPTSLVIGLAVDALDRPLPIVGSRLGVVVVAVVVAAALPVGARTDQEFPAPWDLQNRWIRAAEMIIDATPPGGRYLAPERVEIATTILSSEIYPTYARQRLLGSYGRSGTSDDFDVDLRNELARQVKGGEPQLDPIEALDILGIDTVCTDPRIDAANYALLDAMPEKFERGEQVRLCRLWTRVVPVDG